MVNKKDSLNPADFEPQYYREMHFSIDIEGEKINGYLVPSGPEFPRGAPCAFLVNIKGEPTTKILVHDGEWTMKDQKH
jgi:hypothetical protein